MDITHQSLPRRLCLAPHVENSPLQVLPEAVQMVPALAACPDWIGSRATKVSSATLACLMFTFGHIFKPSQALQPNHALKPSRFLRPSKFLEPENALQPSHILQQDSFVSGDFLQQHHAHRLGIVSGTFLPSPEYTSTKLVTDPTRGGDVSIHTNTQHTDFMGTNDPVAVVNFENIENTSKIDSVSAEYISISNVARNTPYSLGPRYKSNTDIPRPEYNSTNTAATNFHTPTHTHLYIHKNIQ